MPSLQHFVALFVLLCNNIHFRSNPQQNASYIHHINPELIPCVGLQSRTVILVVPPIWNKPKCRETLVEFLVLLSWNVILNELEGITEEVWILWSVSEMQSSTTSYWTNWLWITNWLISHTKTQEHAACQNLDSCSECTVDLLTPVDLLVAGSNGRPAGLVKGRHVCPEQRLLVLHNVMFQATSESGKLFDFTLFCRKNRCKM